MFKNITSEPIMLYFEDNGIFSDDKFGFRSSKSTAHAITNIVHLIVEGLDESEVSAGLFCDDLSKSFGYVAHDIFIDKLRHYKFSFSSWSSIESYLLRFCRTTSYKKSCYI